MFSPHTRTPPPLDRAPRELGPHLTPEVESAFHKALSTASTHSLLTLSAGRSIAQADVSGSNEKDMIKIDCLVEEKSELVL